MRLFRRKGTNRLARAFRDPKAYAEQIDKLYAKALASSTSLVPIQDGVSLSNVAFDRERFSRLMARTVRKQEYEFGIARESVVTVKAKERVILRLNISDHLLHGVASELLVSEMNKHLSESVHSYRKGYSWHTAVSHLARFIREHRKARPNPKDRGLFMIRRDIRKYTDTIPVGDNSPLWPLLRKFVESAEMGGPIDDYSWWILQSIMRPTIETTEGKQATKLLGVPTGSAISTLLFNFYLMDLDRELDAIEGGIYMRYSDDFLFAHPEAEVAKMANRLIDETITPLCLTTKKEKGQTKFFNGAGRPSSDWPEISGTTSVYFLGCNVDFQGVISLKSGEMRKLLKDTRKRIRRTAQLLGDQPTDRKGELIARMLNRYFDPYSPAAHASATMIRRCLTNRGQLKQLDHTVALMLAQELTGFRGTKAFRKIPYRKIREEYGLYSLCVARNRWGRRSKRSKNRQLGQLDERTQSMV